MYYDQHEDKERGEGLLHLIELLRPEKLRDHHRRSASDTDHQRDNKVIDEEGSRYRRQRLFPQKLPDDDAVGHVIKLLQQIADQQRESETQDHLPYRPTRQIPISCINFQFSILNFQLFSCIVRVSVSYLLES